MNPQGAVRIYWQVSGGTQEQSWRALSLAVLIKTASNLRSARLTVPFTFEQVSGKLWQNITRIGSGYAGAFGPTQNNPDAQNIPDKGPLPQGWYTIGEPTNATRCGVEALPLTPDPKNVMFGRSGFFIHGDLIGDPGHASDGCIIMGKATRDIVAAAVASGDNRLQVVATADQSPLDLQS